MDRIKNNARMIDDLLNNLTFCDYYDLFVIQTEGLTNSCDCQTRLFRAVPLADLRWSLNLLSENLIFYHLAQSTIHNSEIVLVTVATSQQIEGVKK